MAKRTAARAARTKTRIGAQYTQLTAETEVASGPRVQDLAPHDRPREKLARLGPSSLGDNELLAIVIGHGSARLGAMALANALLVRTGGLRGLARTSFAQLSHVPGLGQTRAGRVLAAVELGRRSLLAVSSDRQRFRTARDLAEFLLPQFGGRAVEHFGVVLLDVKHRLLKMSVVSVGSFDAAVILPREVFREASLSAAAAVVLFHNHPSGDPTPSPDDLAVTRRMVEAGRLMGIDVLDHLILADARYVSLRETGACG
jgi:DNA repair protein RadC